MNEKILDLIRLGFAITLEKDGLHIVITLKKRGQSCIQYRPDDHHMKGNSLDGCLDYMMQNVEEAILKAEEEIKDAPATDGPVSESSTD